MPIFTRNDGSEAWVDPGTEVFRRGQRLPKDQLRRMRDLIYTWLRCLGVGTEDIASLFDEGTTARQVRNRIDGLDNNIKSVIALAASEAIRIARARDAGRRAGPVAAGVTNDGRGRRCRSGTGSVSIQGLLPFMDQASSSIDD